MLRLLVALALFPSVCWCAKDKGCGVELRSDEFLNVTEDVLKDEHKDCMVGRVVIFSTVSSVGEGGFENAYIANVTIEYANTTLSLGDKAFKGVNEQGSLAIIRRCNPRGCSMPYDAADDDGEEGEAYGDDCYRPYTVGDDTFGDVAVTWVYATCPYMPPSLPSPPQVTPTLPPPFPPPPPPHSTSPPSPPPPPGPGERPVGGVDANRTDDGTSTLPLILSLVFVAALLTGVLVLCPKVRERLADAMMAMRRKASPQQRAAAAGMAVAELDERASLRKGEEAFMHIGRWGGEEVERAETFSKWKGRKAAPGGADADETLVDEEWWLYFGRDNQQNGPVTAEELSRLYDRGTIHDRSYVWKDGMDGWRELSMAPLEYVPAQFKSATGLTPPKPTSKVMLALKPPPLPNARDSNVSAPRRSSVDVGDRVSAVL